ncbi:MAG: NUDIX hydrolase [bacterium]|nr:NUDIX hydrolase [bacterium]
MAKQCDNTSVGILVKNGTKILLIERKQYNYGFALPAGHGDGDDPLTCAKKELGEEVGLTMLKGETVLSMTLPNPCNREGGTHHDWSVVEAVKWEGDVNIHQPDDEAKSYLWADEGMLSNVAKRLEDFAVLIGIKLVPANLSQIVKATNENPAWKNSPGLEPPMYFLFKALKLI